MIPLTLLLLASAVGVAPPDSSIQALTLSEAVALAERNAPAVIRAMGETRNASASVHAAYGAFIPTLTLSTSNNRQIPTQAGQTRVENGQVVTLSPQPWSYSMGLNTTVNVFSGGARLFELQQARALANAADVDVVAQKALAALAAKEQFFNVLAAIESEAAANVQLDLARQQLSMSIVHLRAHTVTRSDSLRSEILVHNGTLELSAARTSRLQAEASLTRTVGLDHRVTAALADTVDAAAISAGEDELHDLALDGPLVHMARSQLEAAKAALRIGWAAYLPSVNASYSRAGTGVSDEFQMSGRDLSYSGAFRMSISLPVFDQFQRESRLTSAKVALENAEASLRDSRLGALESLAQSHGAYVAASDRVETQSATVQAAQEDLRERQQQYKVGTSTLLDVLASQATLVQARRDLIQARYDRRSAKAQLEALTGRSL